METIERRAYVNGEIVPESRAMVSIHDKGFVYGDAVFDTLRTFDGKLFRLEEHVDRLYESLRYVRIEPHLSKQDMKEIVSRVVAANERALRDDEDWWITIRVSAGVMAFDGEPLFQEEPTVVVDCVPLPLRSRARCFKEGVPLVITDRPRIDPQALNPNAKTNNYMNMMLAQREVDALAPGSWALMPDQNGNLAEGPGCNLFLVKNGTAVTPTTEYILAGISRAEVISICHDLGVPIIERNVSRPAAVTADEAFLTSTSLCACPVKSIDGVDLPSDIPGPVTKQVMDAFSERVGFDYVAQYLAFLSNAGSRIGL